MPASFNGYHRVIEPADRPFRDFIALWYRRLRRIRDEAQRLAPGSYLEVRFEDLVEKPRPTLLQLSRFVGLDAPEEWLRDAISRIDLEWARSRKTSDELEASLEPSQHQLLVELGYRSQPYAHG